MRFLAVLMITAVLAAPCGAFELSGRVMLDGKPARGAEVIVADVDGPAVSRTITGDDGRYRIDLPSGTYAVSARHAAGKKRYAGFFGRNPVVVDADQTAGIKLQPVSDVRISKGIAGAIRVTGTVIDGGRPLADARVFFYLSIRDLKGMPYAYTAPTDRGGRFSYDGLIEGSYYVVARKKQGGAVMGPVVEGDAIGFLPTNPLTVRTGKAYRVVIPVFAKEKDEAPALTDVRSRTVIRGRIHGADGKPVAGVYAFAYRNKEMGHQRPVAISAVTGSDGRFELPLPSPGLYYLGAREQYGGTPVQGELYGLYGGSYDHHLDVKEDTREIGIQVDRILR